jgi:hypothetical protein
MRLWTAIGVLALVGLAVSCGKADIGETCDQTSDCKDGLACILKGSRDIGANGLECTTDKLCSKACATDTDCASLGSGLICLSECHDGSCLVGSH